jgi:hypothetical protein
VLRDKMLDSLEAGKSVFIGSATGTGKSMLAALLLHKLRNRRVLYVAPTAAHSQIDATLSEHGLMNQLELMNIRKTTFDSAKHYVQGGKFYDPRPFDLVVLDELHQAGAPTRQDPVRQLMSHANWVVGLSATRWRGIYDKLNSEVLVGEPINEYLGFDVTLDGHDLPSATAHGIVKRCRYIRVIPNDQIVAMEEQIRIARDKARGSDSELDVGLNLEMNNTLMMKRLRAGRSIVFCETIKQARARVAELRALGMRAAEYTSGTGLVLKSKHGDSLPLDDATADENLRWFRETDGTAKTLVTCLKAAEAVHTAVDNVVLWRLTHSYRLYLQMIGRAIQAVSSSDDMTDHPHIFDVMDCVNAIPPQFSYVESVSNAIRKHDARRVAAGAKPLHAIYAPCAEEEQSELMYRVIERAVRGFGFEDVVEFVKREGRMPTNSKNEIRLYKAALRLRHAHGANQLCFEQAQALSQLASWRWGLKAFRTEDCVKEVLEFSGAKNSISSAAAASKEIRAKRAYNASLYIRKEHAAERLQDRWVEELNSIPTWDWVIQARNKTRQNELEKVAKYEDLVEFVRQEKRMPNKLDSRALRNKVAKLHQEHLKEILSDEKELELSELDGWEWFRKVTYKEVVIFVNREKRMPKKSESRVYKCAHHLRSQYKAGTLEESKINSLSSLLGWDWNVRDRECHSDDEWRELIAAHIEQHGRTPSAKRGDTQYLYVKWVEFKKGWEKQPQEFKLRCEKCVNVMLDGRSARKGRKISAQHLKNMRATAKAHSSSTQFKRLADKVLELTGIRHIRAGKFKTATSPELEAILSEQGLTPYEIKFIRYAGDLARVGAPA